MRFVLVTEAAKSGPKAVLRLDEEKCSHLKRVLRLEWNEPLCVLDGAGRLFAGLFEKSGASGAHVRLQNIERTEPAPVPLELVIGLPKNATMDWLVEKAVECGVTAIHPVVTSRSVVKVDSKESAKYVRRWQAIIDGAVEQSERLWRPEVSAPVRWEEYLAQNASHANTIAFLSELRHGSQTDEAAMSEVWSQLSKTAQGPMRVLIGPEGGFNDAEREEMTRCSFTLVSLGKTVLRVETAVISALTLARASRLISASPSCVVRQS